MSTKAIRELIRRFEATEDGGAERALAEVEAIEKAARDLSRLSIEDYTYNIRDRAVHDASFTGDSWEHPDVKAWSDASNLINTIAKESGK